MAAARDMCGAGGDARTQTHTHARCPAGSCAWRPPCLPATWRATLSRWWPSPLWGGWARTRSAWVSARACCGGGPTPGCVRGNSPGVRTHMHGRCTNAGCGAARAFARSSAVHTSLAATALPAGPRCAPPAVLATSVFNVTGLAVLIGFASAMEVCAGLGAPPPTRRALGSCSSSPSAYCLHSSPASVAAVGATPPAVDLSPAPCLSRCRPFAARPTARGGCSWWASSCSAPCSCSPCWRRRWRRPGRRRSRCCWRWARTLTLRVAPPSSCAGGGGSAAEPATAARVAADSCRALLLDLPPTTRRCHDGVT